MNNDKATLSPTNKRTSPLCGFLMAELGFAVAVCDVALFMALFYGTLGFGVYLGIPVMVVITFFLLRFKAFSKMYVGARALGVVLGVALGVFLAVLSFLNAPDGKVMDTAGLRAAPFVLLFVVCLALACGVKGGILALYKKGQTGMGSETGPNNVVGAGSDSSNTASIGLDSTSASAESSSDGKVVAIESKVDAAMAASLQKAQIVRARVLLVVSVVVPLALFIIHFILEIPIGYGNLFLMLLSALYRTFFSFPLIITACIVLFCVSLSILLKNKKNS